MYCTIEVEFILIKKKRIEVILPFLSELYVGVPETELRSRLLDGIEKGYECIGIYTNDELIGICGLWMLVKFYVGKHIEVDNVYIIEEYRNKGIGKELNFWLKKFAQTCGCEAIELNCYLENEGGRRFWENDGFKPIGVHYQKVLSR